MSKDVAHCGAIFEQVNLGCIERYLNKPEEAK